MAIICVATLGTAIMITVAHLDLRFTRLDEWVNTDEPQGGYSPEFYKGRLRSVVQPLTPLYFLFSFIYFYFTCHTVIEITKNRGKVEKRSGKET